MENAVECHSGHTYAERPKAFNWNGEWIKVETIEAEWRSPQGKHFRVKAENGSVFELIYDETSDDWQVR